MKLLIFLFVFVLFCFTDYEITLSKVEKRIEREEEIENERIRKEKQKEYKRRENKQKEINQTIKESSTQTYHNINDIISERVKTLYIEIYKIINETKKKNKNTELLYKYQFKSLDYICIDGIMYVKNIPYNVEIIDRVNKRISNIGSIKYFCTKKDNYPVLSNLILKLKGDDIK